PAPFSYLDPSYLNPSLTWLSLTWALFLPLLLIWSTVPTIPTAAARRLFFGNNGWAAWAGSPSSKSPPGLQARVWSPDGQWSWQRSPEQHPFFAGFAKTN